MDSNRRKLFPGVGEVEGAIYKAIEWYKPYVEGDMASNRFRDIMEKQVKEFLKQRS